MPYLPGVEPVVEVNMAAEAVVVAIQAAEAASMLEDIQAAAVVVRLAEVGIRVVDPADREGTLVVVQAEPADIQEVGLVAVAGLQRQVAVTLVELVQAHHQAVAHLPDIR